MIAIWRTLLGPSMALLARPPRCVRLQAAMERGALFEAPAPRRECLRVRFAFAI